MSYDNKKVLCIGLLIAFKIMLYILRITAFFVTTNGSDVYGFGYHVTGIIMIVLGFASLCFLLLTTDWIADYVSDRVMRRMLFKASVS